MVNAFKAEDLDALGNLYSRSPVFRNVGSDGDEYWDDPEEFQAIVRAQIAEMHPFDFVIDRIEGFELGTVGWGLSLGSYVTSDGTEVPMRMSSVFCLENGVWRCVFAHSSIPVPNEEALGVQLTTTLSALLESLDEDVLAPIEGRVGTSALMFTDIEGSTALAHEMGDDRWAQVLAEHDRTISDVASRHHGRVIKTLGDGALVAFDGARHALRSAVELQAEFAHQPVSVRIGIHCGDVVHSGDDVIGATVNKAARVTAAAGGGQVVVSSVTRELAGDGGEFAYGDPFLAELKGIPGVHELVPLVVAGMGETDQRASRSTRGTA